MTQIEELTLRFLDGELNDDEIEQLEELIDGDPEAREVFVALLEQEGALRGLALGDDVSDATIAQIRERLAERVREGAMEAIRASGSGQSGDQKDDLAPPAEVLPIEKLSPWLGSRAIWLALAAVTLLALYLGYDSVAVRLEPVPEYEVSIYGYGKASPGKATSFRARVASGRTGVGLENAGTRFRLVDGQGETVWEERVTTDADGMALVQPQLADDLAEGSYQLEVEAEGGGEVLKVGRGVQVERSFRLFLSTDKPRYQPGQVIHIRSLALFSMDRHPVEDQEVTIEVRDGRGNKVFNRRLETSDFGLAAADFQLADQVNMGEFTIRATIGDTSSERTVTVERYVLPRFRVELDTSKGYYAPGDKVTGELTATYTFGEPVSGAKVKLVASEFVEQFRPFETVEGVTDSEGRFPFELRLKSTFVGQPSKQGDAIVSFEAIVTDRADHSQERTLERTVTTESIRVDMIPESGELIAGVDNEVYVVTSYPDGRAAPALVTVEGTDRSIRTNEAGFATWTWSPGSPTEMSLVVTDDHDQTARSSISLLTDANATQALLLRADRAVYRTGETVNLSLLTASTCRRAFIDVIKEGQTVLTTAIDIEDGRGELALDLPDDLSGTLAITAYRTTAANGFISDTRLIQVNDSEELEIAAELDQETYRPAETATLRLRVSRGGEPTVAALSLWGVDEAVFALQESRPGLERVYFALQAELLEPRYEIHGHLDQDLLLERGDASSGSEESAAVQFATARGISGPEVATGMTYQERFDEQGHRVDESSKALWGLVALSPSILVSLLLLFVIGYGLWRLFHRVPVQGLPEEDLRVAKRLFRSMVVTWVAALFVPWIAALLVSAARLFNDEEAVLLVGGGLWIAAVVTLFLLARRIRRLPLAASVPVLRRMVLLMPIAYLLVPLAIVALVWADEYPSVLDNEWIAGALGTMLVLAILTTGSLSSAASSVMRKLSIWGSLWIGTSRNVIAALPLVALITVIIIPSSTMSMSPAGMAGDMVMEEAAVQRFAQAEPSMPPPSSMDAPSAGPLKAPTRVRQHFPETLFWQPEVITDEAGQANLEIPLADSITTWRVGIGAVSREGLLGSSTVGIRVFQPFFVDLDLPLELTQNDRVMVRVAVYNYLDDEQTVRLELSSGSWLDVLGNSSQTLNLAPREITQVSFPVVALEPGEHPLTVRAFGSAMADAVERQVRVAPDGQPVEQTSNGRLGEGVELGASFPLEAIPGASSLVLKVYPGAFSQVIEGLDGILRMPNGCFEQTSSSTYPNVLVLNYLRQNRQANPEIEMRALEYIGVGYQRLLSFEVAGGGFEWFGNPPAHIVLTAYGLMEFTDMAEVFEVDPAVIERTGQWLLNQQQSDGSFRPTEGGIAEGAINAFQGQTLRTTAYVAWALGEADLTDSRVGRALSYIESNIGNEEDPYTLALAANAMLANNRDAAALLRRLDEAKVRDGDLVHWAAAGEGVTHSAGNVLDLETTALVAYAFQRARFSLDTAHAALAWLVSNKDSFGTWQSTQATIHAMRALLAGSSSGGDLEQDLHVSVDLNGETVEELTITQETADVFHTLVLSEHLRIGDNQVRVRVDHESQLDYQLVATHYRPWPDQASAPEEPLSIDLEYDASNLESGDFLTARVNLAYNRPGAAQMTIVDLGIPPGFELDTDAFESLRHDGVIERYSVTERQVILYFREIRRGEPVSFSYRMRAEYPLRVTTPRSAAYQYYEPDLRDETTPVELTVR